MNTSQQPGNECGSAVRSQVQRTTLNTDLAPTGADIEPIESPHEDAEAENDEVEEPLEAHFPIGRMIPKNPAGQENMKILDVLFIEVDFLDEE